MSEFQLSIFNIHVHLCSGKISVVFFAVILQNSFTDTMGLKKVSVKSSGKFLGVWNESEIFTLISMSKINLRYKSFELQTSSRNELNSYLKALLYLVLQVNWECFFLQLWLITWHHCFFPSQFYMLIYVIIYNNYFYDVNLQSPPKLIVFVFKLISATLNYYCMYPLFFYIGSLKIFTLVEWLKFLVTNIVYHCRVTLVDSWKLL